MNGDWTASKQMQEWSTDQGWVVALDKLLARILSSLHAALIHDTDTDTPAYTARPSSPRLTPSSHGF
jgi:hypothetical protein